MKKERVNDIDLAIVDRGSGPTLLFVHGYPLDHRMWYAQIEPFSQRCRIVAPDLRGFGLSDVTEGKVTMEQMADDLAALLDTLKLDEPIIYCGLSMGGYIAWEFCRKYGSRLRGLILCDTRAAADTPEAAAVRLVMADRVIAEGPQPLVDVMMPKLFAEKTVKSQPRVVESLREVMMATDPKAIAATGRGMAERRDATEMLGQIDCTTLVLVGQHDALTPPEEMEKIAEGIPNSRFVTIPDAGHMSPMEKPADVNAAITAFLDELEA